MQSDWTLWHSKGERRLWQESSIRTPDVLSPGGRGRLGTRLACRHIIMHGMRTGTRDRHIILFNFPIILLLNSFILPYYSFPLFSFPPYYSFHLSLSHTWRADFRMCFPHQSPLIYYHSTSHSAFLYFTTGFWIIDEIHSHLHVTAD